jgi:hypothetical protein
VATSTPAVSPPAAELSTGLGAPGPEPVDGEGDEGLVRVDVPEGDHADRVRAAGVDRRDSFVLLDVVGDDEGPTASSRPVSRRGSLIEPTHLGVGVARPRHGTERPFLHVRPVPHGGPRVRQAR